VTQVQLRILGRESSWQKLRRDSPFGHRGFNPQGSSNGLKVVVGRSLHRGRESTIESSCRFAKSRGSLDLGKGARHLVLRRGEILFHHSSANRGWWVREAHARRNREVGFPDLIGTVNSWRDRWHKSENIGVSTFGVSNSRRLGVADPRTANSRSDVAVWDPEVSGRHVEAYRRIGVRGFEG
jgi:hypothetical protein